MKSDGNVTDRLSRSAEHRCASIVSWRVQLGIELHVAASDRVFCYARSREVERAALARMRRLGWAVLRMKRPHAREQAGWAKLDPVAEVDRARQHRSGRHHADARQREDAIDREPKPLHLRDRALAPDASSRCARSASTPAPVSAETVRTSACASVVAAIMALPRRATFSIASGKPRSALVMTTAPRSTPSRSRIARCSASAA